MSWNPTASGGEYPKFDDEHKQEAARFLVTNVDARPLIRGIVNEERLKAWEEVAEMLDGLGDQGRALRQRREALTGDDLDADEAFSAASQLDPSGEDAVADGGAVVDDEVEEKLESDDDDDQDVMEYEDAAERKSKRQEAEQVAKMYDTIEDVEKKLQEEFSRHLRRPHVVDALESRLEVLADAS